MHDFDRVGGRREKTRHPVNIKSYEECAQPHYPINTPSWNPIWNGVS